jgi:hypothetical protein
MNMLFDPGPLSIHIWYYFAKFIREIICIRYVCYAHVAVRVLKPSAMLQANTVSFAIGCVPARLVA